MSILWHWQEKLCRQFSFLMWTSFIAMRGVVILVSCEYHFIRIHSRNDKSIVVLKNLSNAKNFCYSVSHDMTRKTLRNLYAIFALPTSSLISNHFRKISRPHYVAYCKLHWYPKFYKQDFSTASQRTLDNLSNLKWLVKSFRDQTFFLSSLDLKKGVILLIVVIGCVNNLSSNVISFKIPNIFKKTHSQ